jgi:hypothetical protein
MSQAMAQNLISNFAENVTLKRTAPGSFVNGIYVPGAETSSTIIASVQPMSSMEMENYPELQRSSEVLKLYCAEELQVAKESTGAVADKIVMRGKTYQVQRVEPWQYAFSFSKAIVVRVEPA